VAKANTSSNEERIVYSGPSGTYRLAVYSYKGAGTYDLWVNRPA
jgi:hypothetical protein